MTETEQAPFRSQSKMVTALFPHLQLWYVKMTAREELPAAIR